MPERRIGDFFIELFENPELRDVVDRHWDEIAAEWGLDDEQRQILRERDPEAIRRRIIEEYGDYDRTPWVVVVWGWTFQASWNKPPGP